MKKLFIVLLVIILSLLGAVLLKDQAIKAVVTVVATQVTGAPVHINGLSVGIFKPAIKISGFKLYNPAGFPKGILIDLDKINIEYDLGAILKRKLHLINAEIKLKEMSLVKNKDGRLNVDSLKVAKQSKKEPGKGEHPMPMQIDNIKLGIGRIIMTDYTGQKPAINVYNLYVDKAYKNITSAQQLAALILTEPMKAAGIQGATIYGAAMLTGVAFLPVAAAMTFAGKDSDSKKFKVSVDKAFNTSVSVLNELGSISIENKTRGAIDGETNSCQVSIRVSKADNSQTIITVSARKYLMPRPEVAAGLLYEIEQKLK